MKGHEMHYSTEQFNLLLDGRLDEAEAETMRNHLAHCVACHSALSSLERLDLAVRNIPVLEVHERFTSSVMEGILRRSVSPLAFRVFEKLSYVFGLLIVLGIMITSFIVTGVVETRHVDQTKDVAAQLAGQVGHGLSVSLNGFTAWLIQYLPFAFGKGSISVAFFAVAVLLMLAVVDRVIGRRMGKTN